MKEHASTTLVEEVTPFRNMQKSAKNKNIVNGPDTKNDCAGLHSSNLLDWIGSESAITICNYA
jgi:hypothetical protein